MRSYRLFVITGLTLGVGLAALALTMDAQTRRPPPPDAVSALQQTPAEKAAQQAMWEEFVSLRESRASRAALQDWAKKYNVKLDTSGTTLLVTRTLAAPGGSEPPRDPGVAATQKCSLKNSCTFRITHRVIRGRIVGGLDETCSYSGCWTDIKTKVVTCFGKITCSYKVGFE